MNKAFIAGWICFLMLAVAMPADPQEQNSAGWTGTSPGALPSMAEGAVMQSERIEPVAAARAGVASTYLGETTYSQRNLIRLTDAHLQLFGNTGAWASQTNLLTILANRAYGNDGNQGAFWDPDYRIAYGGQDGAAAFIGIQGRTPVIRNAAVASFGSTLIVTPAGPRPVYTIKLVNPLSQAQRNDVDSRPQNIRLETNNGYFGYVISPGFHEPSGESIRPVSVDGSTLVIDNWVCTACRPEVSAKAAATPPPQSTVTVDALHQIDGIYGGWTVRDGDGLAAAMNVEQANVNNRTGLLPPLNLVDPQSSNPLLLGRFDGVQSDNEGGQGAGVAHDLCTTGWQACFVARNMPSFKTGTTYGFLAPAAGPDFGFFSAQTRGYVLAADPGDSCRGVASQCQRSVLLDTKGNLTLGGGLTAMGVVVQRGITSNGPIRPGNYVLKGAPLCSSESLGAHVYIADGRKPGELPDAGSGTPADCTPPGRGRLPVWVSVYDHLVVRS